MVTMVTEKITPLIALAKEVVTVTTTDGGHSTRVREEREGTTEGAISWAHPYDTTVTMVTRNGMSTFPR